MIGDDRNWMGTAMAGMGCSEKMGIEERDGEKERGTTPEGRERPVMVVVGWRR